MKGTKRRWNYALDEDTQIAVSKARDLCGEHPRRCVCIFEEEDWAFSAKSLYEIKERVKEEFGGKWSSPHSAWIIRAESETEAKAIRDGLQADIDPIAEEYRAKKRAKDTKVVDVKRSEAAKRVHARRREAFLLKNGYCAKLTCAGKRESKC
jgi:hypothetical protein